MNLLFKLLLIVIAFAGATGHYARAPMGESNFRPQVWVPRVAQAPASIPAVAATTIAVAYPVPVPAVVSGSAELSLPERTTYEPSGWALLLSSFVVVGFIARRRSQLGTG